MLFPFLPSIQAFTLSDESTDLKSGVSELVEQALSLQTKSFQDGIRLSVDSVFRRFPGLANDEQAQLAVLYQDFRLGPPAEQHERLRNLVAKFPERALDLKRQVDFGIIVDSVIGDQSTFGKTIGLGATKPLPGTDSGSNCEPLLKESPITIGRFQVVRLIGHGGMGSVYLADDRELDRQVAIKIPRYASSLSDRERQKFVQEAKIVGGLNHPYLMDVFDIGKWNHGFYLVSRFADAGDLSKWLVDHEGPHPAAKVVELMCSITSAVAHCHQRGIIHFDLKPANILFQSPSNPDDEVYFPGIPKVADFGLARICEKNDLATQTSAVFGTLLYMAPEQIESQHRRLGASTDVFALGVILFELLTGRHPFAADTAIEMMDRIRGGCPAADIKKLDVPKPLQEICRNCLATAPEDRYPSAYELHRDLQKFSNGESLHGHRFSRWKQLRRWMEMPQRIPQAAAACLTGNVVILMGFLGALAVKSMPDSPIPGPLSEFLLDFAKLAVFPHLPMIYVSWRVMRGSKRWHWINLAFSMILVGLVATSLIAGQSPVRAYNADPFTFWMVHVIIFSIAVYLLAIQLIAVPAMIRQHRDRKRD